MNETHERDGAVREPREPMRQSQQYLDPSVERRATIRRLGWPMTKAGYLKALFGGRIPDFPLDAEIEVLIPRDLPGKMPTCSKDPALPARAPGARGGSACISDRRLGSRALHRPRRRADHARAP